MCLLFILCKYMKFCGEKKLFKKYIKLYGYNKIILVIIKISWD